MLPPPIARRSTPRAASASARFAIAPGSFLSWTTNWLAMGRRSSAWHWASPSYSGDGAGGSGSEADLGLRVRHRRAHRRRFGFRGGLAADLLEPRRLLRRSEERHERQCRDERESQQPAGDDVSRMVFAEIDP